MESNRPPLITGLGPSQIAADGKTAVIEMQTDIGRSALASVDTDEGLQALITGLLEVAFRAGQIQEIPQSFAGAAPKPVLPLKATSWGLSLGAAGVALLVMRIGTLDLAVEIDGANLLDLSAKLAAFGARQSQEPGQIQ